MAIVIKERFRKFTPPILIEWLKSARDHLSKAPMEFVSEWPESVRGWNVESIAEMHARNWSAYLASLHGITPFGVGDKSTPGPDVDPWDIINHNNVVSFAAVLGMAAQGRRELAFLDWGGGVGHYCALVQTLMPNLVLDYHCQDLPVFCEVGRKNLPAARFWSEPDACFLRTYDLVFAGSSLWYARDWRCMLKKLARATKHYLFVSRMIFVSKVESFVAIQRPASAHGYATEYPMWILNREEFLGAARASGLEPVREFLIGHGPRIHRAPEEGAFRGFLFRPLAAP
jgi:putative methyltransferase (TIGR04325 family)